ncbi:radical SAM protein [bacterium]|nr:radical SAM protein [bacterium]
MTSIRLKNMMITTDKKGVSQFNKTSFPQRFGRYSEIRTQDYEFQFNLKGEIKSIRGLNMSWPHPSEILRRTDGNDWVYHSVGASAGPRTKVKEAIGEYYLPCPIYPTNTVWAFNPYSDPNIAQAFGAWYQLFGTLFDTRQQGLIPEIKNFIDLVMNNDDNKLLQQTELLHSIIGGRLSVLPPDTRHVEYEVIPLVIADGCLYHCDFCKVKTHQKFQPQPREKILRQLEMLKAFYGENIQNYAALFLGNHDALAAGRELVEWSAIEAYNRLDMRNAFGNNPKLFLFGSVASLLKADDTLFEQLDRSPFYTTINIGFESVDEDTLHQLKKPMAVKEVREAFEKMMTINRDYPNLEITGNFLLGENLSQEHNQSLTEFLGNIPNPKNGKGAVYLSPLMGGNRAESLLPLFYQIKERSRLPTYLYLIQRL